MIFKRFALRVAVRLAVLFACLLALAWVVAATDFVAASLLLAALAIGLTVELFAFLNRVNAEIVRFLEAVRHSDFSQSFSLDHMGSGFAELGQALSGAMGRFRAVRAGQETELRTLKAMVDQVPVPLLSLAADGRAALLNNAARRFFTAQPVTRLADLEAYGADLPTALATLEPGERRLVRLSQEAAGGARVALSLTRVITASEELRLVAVHNISSELDATELDAWQQLVRVLTHEIMNSLTPVSSLAETAAALLKDADDDPSARADARDAVETVARRSAALMHFVQSYRRLTRLPTPRPEPLRVAGLFDRLDRLMRSGREAMPPIHLSVEPDDLTVRADPEQIEQVLINLIRNAAEALEGRPDGTIWLGARFDRSGRVAIEVADNGPGVPRDVADKIFVPFFTTKRSGSGVGLALTRQVMIAHAGNVSVRDRADGGAVFRLVF